MAGRRILYLLAWVGSMVFFYAYRQWFAWVTLVAVLCLPVFSLIVSLPAMLSARVELEVPKTLTVGTEVPLELRIRSPLPTPPWKYGLILERPITGESWRMKGGRLPADHCGALFCTVEKVRVCDYLGLFSLPVRGSREAKILVRPVPVAMQSLPELEQYLSAAWRPKPGGGFAENHELRLYRPGDQIQQIHWKLSAKTGRLILREPMEPERGRVLLRLDLKGSAEELDRKLGRLLWLGGVLLERKIRFEIQCLTGNGVEYWAVDGEEGLQAALDALLAGSPAGDGSLRDRVENACWQYYIGGGTDET